MKKRTVTAIIITIIAIIATSKYWFITEPLPVNFDISGHGNCNIEVQLNKKDNDEFRKVKSESVFINLDKEKHADIFVNRAGHPKRIKIILSDLSSREPITISNIRFRNGKYTLGNIEKFNADGAKVKAEGKNLIIIPNKKVITITYPDTLNVCSGIKFDFMLFCIILILTFLLAYKLSNYVAEFSTLKGKSRVEIIFLTIFFVFLFIPMMYINKDEKSIQENRYLAKWKPLISDNNKINFSFGNNFNEWFNDRFYLRQVFVNLRSSITMLIANTSEKGFIDKKTKTMYTDLSFGHIDIDIIKDNFKALYDFNNWCSKHNIKLYILIVPNKADIHTTKYNYINDNYKHEEFADYISEINKEDKIKVIYPYQAMLNAVKEGKQLYFKTEHHWTDDGAFVGYNELMKEIIKDYPKIRVLNSADFNYTCNKMVRGDFLRSFGKGKACSKIGISDSVCSMYHHYDYKYYKHKDFDNLNETVINTKYRLEKIYHYNGGANLRVIQLGTSQNENLTEFIPYTFKDVKRIRNNDIQGIKSKDIFKIIKYYGKEMLDYKPDIIIFCITYKNTDKLHNLFNME